MIVELAEYLSACPYLAERGVKVNYLDKEVASASLEMTKADSTFRGYADGGELIRKTFVLALTESFVASDHEMKTVAKKCKEIENWIKEKNNNREFPQLEDLVVMGIEVSKSFAQVMTNTKYARYEAEIQVIYYI